MGERAGYSIQRVLLVDDDELLLEGVRRSMGHDFTLFLAKTPIAARYLAATEKPEIAIVDLRLGRSGSGIDLIRTLKSEHRGLRVALVSAYLSVVSTVEALRAGAEYAFFKPITYREIISWFETDAPKHSGSPRGLVGRSWPVVHGVQVNA
jgi:two-component system, NtrC family, response regulator AtoC